MTNDLQITVSIDDSKLRSGLERVKRDAETTEARINQIGSASSAITAKQAEAAANAKIREQQKAAREVERINSQTARSTDQTDRLIERSAKQLADYRIKESKRAANEFIADLEKNRSAAETQSSTSSFAQGIAFGGGAGAAIEGVKLAVGAVKQLVSISEQGVTGLFELSKASSDFGSKIFDASQKVSLSAETLSTIKVAADISGSSLDDFTNGFIKFEKNLAEAAHGNEQLGKTFRALGVDVQAGVRDPEAALSQFLKTFNKLPEGADRAAVNIALFGKSGAQLTPTFIELGSNLDAAKEKAERLGLVFDSNAAAAADRFGDTLDVVKKQLTGVGYTIGNEFEPIFTDALSSVSKALADNKDQIKLWATTGADFVAGFASGISGFESIAERTLDNVNNRLRDYGTSVTDIYNKIKAINSTLPLQYQSPIFGIVDNAEKLRAEGAADRPRREALARAAKARADLENNRINFATGKIVGDDGPNLSFLGGDEAAKKAEEAIRKINGEALKFASVFSELSARAQSDNPFVRIFNEGDSALAKFKDELKGLSPSIVKQFTDLQATINFKNLFSAQLDASLSAFDLRDQANKFRNSKAKNPDYFFDPTNSIQGSFTTVRQGADLSRLNRTIINDEPTKLQPTLDRQLNIIGDPVIALAARLRQEDPNKTLQERLSKQFDIINSQVNATNKDPNTLAIADKRFISLTNGVDPNTLTAQQRDVAAGAREREAVRIETNEKAAQKERIDQTAAQKSLASDMKEVLNLFKSGKAKIDLGEAGSVTVTVDENGKTSITPQNSPTPQPQPLN